MYTCTCIYYAYKNCICMTGLQVHEECNKINYSFATYIEHTWRKYELPS